MGTLCICICYFQKQGKVNDCHGLISLHVLHVSRVTVSGYRGYKPSHTMWALGGEGKWWSAVADNGWTSGLFMFCYLFFYGFTSYYYIAVPLWHGLLLFDIPNGTVLQQRGTEFWTRSLWASSSACDLLGSRSAGYYTVFTLHYNYLIIAS